MQSTQLPVMTASGALVQHIYQDEADCLPHRYRPHFKTRIRNGKTKTKITGYTLIEKPANLDCRPDSRLGLAFEQHLPSGATCYALSGVSGSH